MTDHARLDAAYAAGTKEEVQALYDDWAESYDAELAAQGYAAPARCAAALLEAGAAHASPVLDAGCGTGLCGAALKAAGFTTIDGTDFSDRMLAAAEAKGIYRKLTRGDLENPLPAKKGAYAAISACGVFSPGHAPATLIDAALHALDRGGRFVFTLNDHALEDGSYEGRLREWIDGGWARVAVKERGPHMPGIGLEAEVWVVERL